MAASQCKLYYFDAKGRAEAARLVLVAAGKKFEDIRFAEEDWPKYKSLSPFGQCPILEVNGKRYGQSLAIKSFLARENGLHGKTNLEGLEIDQITQLADEYINIAVKAMFAQDEATKKKAQEQKAEAAPKFLDNLEKLLKPSAKGYFVGERQTLADLVVFDVFTGMLANSITVDDKHPLLKKNLELVRADKNIAPYLAARKATPF